MKHGILSGLFWAFQTVIIGIVLQQSVFISTPKAIMLASFISTFFHDLFSSLIMHILSAVKGTYPEAMQSLKSKNGKYLLLGGLIGGPIGMGGYFLAINYLGPSIGALSSAIYPAIGAFLAYIFLKQDLSLHRWLFLIVTLTGVFLLSFTPELNVTNFWLGILGAFMCSFGWGLEGVIVNKCLNDKVSHETCLMIRQTVSFIILGAVVLPIIGGYELIRQIDKPSIFIMLFFAGLFATLSDLYYYKAIGKLGVSKAMALNITYVPFATLFTIVFLRDYSLLNVYTLSLIVIVITSSLLTAIDFKHRHEDKIKIKKV